MTQLSHPMRRLWLMTAFASLWLSAVAMGQADSVIVLSPRVGRVIDSNERKYFGVFTRYSDSAQFSIVRTGTGEAFLRFSDPGQPQIAVDSAQVAEILMRIEFCEELKAGVLPSTDVTESEEGSRITVVLDSSRVLSGELLFADVHGIVIRDTMVRAISSSDIRAITSPREFGAGSNAMARVGVGFGVVAYGVGGALGSDVESGGGVFLTLFFSAIGAGIGLVYDVIAASGDREFFSKGTPWGDHVIQDLQSESRYPLGTPDLKRMLGEVHEAL